MASFLTISSFSLYVSKSRRCFLRDGKFLHSLQLAVPFGYAAPALRLPFGYAQGKRSVTAKSKGRDRGVELRDNNLTILSPINLSTFPQTKLSNGLDISTIVNPVLSETPPYAIITSIRSVRKAPWESFSFLFGGGSRTSVAINCQLL